MKPSGQQPHQTPRVRPTRVVPDTTAVGGGCAMQVLGLLALFAGALWAGVPGFIMGCVALLVLGVMGSARARRWVCGACGNPLYSNAVTLCPSCRSPVRYEPSLWPWVFFFLNVAAVGGVWFLMTNEVKVLPKWAETASISPTAADEARARYAERRANLPSIQEWTFAEVVSRHGEPLGKCKETGWAVWREFRARFENGAVVEVGMPGD